MTERVAQLAFRILEADLRSAGRVYLGTVERSWRERGFERQQRDDRLDDSGSPEGVPGPTLGGAGMGAVRKQLRDEPPFDLVVLLARGSVQVDVVDRIGGDAGAAQ